jgi:hypothetical protein
LFTLLPQVARSLLLLVRLLLIILSLQVEAEVEEDEAEEEVQVVIEHLLTEKHLEVEDQAKLVLPWVQEVTPVQSEQVELDQPATVPTVLLA